MLEKKVNKEITVATTDEVKGERPINPIFNPFPGLRPFSVDECHLFFGREGQIDEVLLKLSRNRFVTVMGYSGSGKSSLIACGLIPTLYGGFMTETGPNWSVIATRPGANPIGNLSKAILKVDPEYHQCTTEELMINQKIIASLLRSNPKGLVEAVLNIQQKSEENTLVVIDQFEELFRSAKNDNDNSIEDAKIYVNLILEACKSSVTPIYVVLTMRSDFIGECAKFPGLTVMINSSNYLVPQMSRNQKRMAIEGPVSVGGGRISKRLVRRLLNEVGDNQDQLPIMQHALMRTWNYWVENREQDEPLDIRHYNAVGRMSHALSQHADESYDELTPDQKEVAEILFKSLTERGADARGRRRPVKLSLVAQLAEVSEEEVITVVEAFRKVGRSFLMPAPPIALSGDTQVEIAHESLMRIWAKLESWVVEENESARMYRRLSESAAMYQVGRTGLWRPPDLQLALNWQKKQKPTRAWAQRYDEAYERAIVFLDTSRVTYEAEQRNQEMLQKRLLRRAKMVALILGFAAVVAILFLIGGYSQYLEAQKQEARANEETIEAQKRRDEAQKQRDLAEQQELIATEAKSRAEENEQIAREALAQARIQQLKAEQNANIARVQSGIAEDKRQEALVQTQIAEQEYARAEANYNRAQKLLYQSVAQSMAVKALGIEDVDLKGLLAKQAYEFNTTYEGRKFDPYIYNGLYDAMASINGKTYNTISGIHRNSVRSITFGQSSDQFYSTGAQGKIVRSSFEGDKNVEILSNRYRNRVLKLSEDERWLVNANDSAAIQVIDLTNNKVRVIEGHTTYVNDIAFLPGKTAFLSVGGNGQLRLNDLQRLSSEFIKTTQGEYKVLAIDPTGVYAIAGTLDGKSVLINLDDYSESIIMDSPGIPVHAVAFSMDGKIVAIGDESGTIKLYDLDANEIIREYKAHKGRVSDIEFSPNGGLVAAGSFDGTIQMWALDELDELPIQMTDNDAYVWDIVFTPDSDYLLAACADGEIRTWATNPALMADEMCDQLKRNMSPEEWKIYVGNGIQFEVTCIKLLLNDY